MDIRYLNKIVNEGFSKVNDSYSIKISEDESNKRLKANFVKEDGFVVKSFDKLSIPTTVDNFLTELQTSFMSDYEFEKDFNKSMSDKYFYRDFLPKVKDSIDYNVLTQKSGWTSESELLKEDERRKQVFGDSNLKREVENYVFDGEIREVGKSFIDKINDYHNKKYSGYWTQKLADLESSDYLTLSDIVKSFPESEIKIAMAGNHDDINLTDLIEGHKLTKDEMFIKQVKLNFNLDAIDDLASAGQGIYYKLSRDKAGKETVKTIYLDESSFEKLNISQKLGYLDKDHEME